MQQLDAAQQETRAQRESADKSRMEVFMLKSQLDSSAASIRFELDSARGENERLKQLLEALRVELESNKRENSEVDTLPYCSTKWMHNLRLFLIIF